MASEKDDVFDPFDKMFPAEEECTTPEPEGLLLGGTHTVQSARP